MSVICRFRVAEVEPQTAQTRVRLTALYSPEGVEDGAILEEIRQFHEATPNGTLEMWIRNQAAGEQFQVNDEYYIRLEKIPTEKTIQALYAKNTQDLSHGAEYGEQNASSSDG